MLDIFFGIYATIGAVIALFMINNATNDSFFDKIFLFVLITAGWPYFVITEYFFPD